MEATKRSKTISFVKLLDSVAERSTNKLQLSDSRLFASLKRVIAQMEAKEAEATSARRSYNGDNFNLDPEIIALEREINRLFTRKDWMDLVLIVSKRVQRSIASFQGKLKFVLSLLDGSFVKEIKAKIASNGMSDFDDWKNPDQSP